MSVSTSCRFELFQLGSEHGEILFDFLGQILAIKPHSGVVTRHILAAFMFDESAPGFFNTLQTEHLFHRQTAEEQNESRVNQFDLFEQIERGTCLYLFSFGCSIRGRTALDHVRDKEISPLETGPLDHMIEVTAGVAHE